MVLGELREGRHTLLERVTLPLTVPANVRAEVMGGFAHTMLSGTVEVLVAGLLPDRPKRLVFRLHCPDGEAGTALLLGASAGGALAGDEGFLEARPADVELRLVSGFRTTRSI